MIRHRLRQVSLGATAVFALALLAACARDAESVEVSENAILPNSEIFELGHDGDTYRRIAETFGSRGLDLNVDLTSFTPGWPLDDAKPSVLNRHGTPMLYASFGYFHTGVDVIRSSAAVAKEVVAPHDGLALVFDWAGNRISAVTAPYATIVAIYDPTSHVVTQLLHVAATDALAKATEPVAVTKGTVLGTLAPAPLANADDALRLANTQIAFVDGANNKLLNPARFLASYTDVVAPEAKQLYLTDEAGQIVTELSTGKLDLVVEVADRDDTSARNLEVSAFSFTAKDQDGNVVASSDKCELDSFYESIASGASFRARDLVDFGTALQSGQVSGAWTKSDVDNADRTFRYALTNVEVQKGRCAPRADSEGFAGVGDKVTKLEVSVTLWDAKGNESTKSFEIARPAPAVDPDAGPAEDAGDAGGDAAVDPDGGI